MTGLFFCGVIVMRIFRIIPFLIFLMAVGAFGYTNYYVDPQKDVAAPEISVPEGTLEISVETSRDQLLSGITALDAVDGDLTDHLLVESLEDFDENHERTLHVAVVDAAGNVARATRQVSYKNYHSPRFSLKEPLILLGDTSSVAQKFQAEDLLDGDISARIKIGSGYHLGNDFGDYPLEFFVSNSAGDVSRIRVTVTMPDIAAYLSSSSITLTDYLVYADADHKVDPWQYLESISLENMLYVRSGDALLPADEDYIRTGFPEQIEKSDVKITGEVSYQTPGTYEYLYSYTLEGNKVAVRLIVVVE